MKRSRPRRAWIYKCSLQNPNRAQGWSWVAMPGGWLISKDQKVGTNFGGDEWIRSPKSWANLARARKGDLVFCHQTDLHGIAGLSVAASNGYFYGESEREDICNCIDLGPIRIKFDHVVTVREIRRAVGKNAMVAYGKGVCQHTFHPVEADVLRDLLKLCCQLNPRQAKRIVQIAKIK